MTDNHPYNLHYFRYYDIFFFIFLHLLCVYIKIYIVHILIGVDFDVKHDVLRWKDVEDWREFQRAQITHGQELVANNVK